MGRFILFFLVAGFVVVSACSQDEPTPLMDEDEMMDRENMLIIGNDAYPLRGAYLLDGRNDTKDRGAISIGMWGDDIDYNRETNQWTGNGPTIFTSFYVSEIYADSSDINIEEYGFFKQSISRGTYSIDIRQDRTLFEGPEIEDGTLSLARKGDEYRVEGRMISSEGDSVIINYQSVFFWQNF